MIDARFAPPVVDDSALHSSGYRRSAIVSWTLILLCVAFRLYEVKTKPEDGRAKRSASTSSPTTKPASAEAADANDRSDFRIAARMALGSHLFTTKLTSNASTPGKGNAASPMKSVDDAAKSPTEKLRAAIIAGEVEGADGALHRLDALSEQLNLPTTQSASVEHEAGNEDGDVDREDLKRDVATLRLLYQSGPSTQPSSAPSTQPTTQIATTAPSLSRPASALTHEQRAGLLARHGRYARIALVYGTPTSAPEHDEIRSSALDGFIALIGLGITMLVLGLLGFIGLIVAIVLKANRVLPMWYVPTRPAVPRAVFAEAFAVFMVVFTGLQTILTYAAVPHWLKYLPLVVIVGVMLVTLAWPVLRGVSWREARLGMGWHLGPGSGSDRFVRMLREMGWGALGMMCAMPLLVGGFFVATKLSKWAGVSPTHPIIKEMGAGGWQLFGVYMLACVLAPLMEETVFRGALFNHMRRSSGWLVSAVTTGVFFAAIHPQGWTLIPALGTTGVVLAAIREWRGGLVAPMTAHFLNNFVVITFVSIAMG